VTTLGDPLGVKNFPIFPVLKISFIKNNIIIDYFIENDFYWGVLAKFDREKSFFTFG
jgi:hypothetical protein